MHLLGISVIYAMFLAFLLFQSYKDFLAILQYFDPKLKDAKPETEVKLNLCVYKSVCVYYLDMQNNLKIYINLFLILLQKCSNFVVSHNSLPPWNKIICDVINFGNFYFFKVYANDCSLAVFWSRLDIFCVAHFLGYTVKAIMLRNASMLWLMSITWEFTEVSI